MTSANDGQVIYVSVNIETIRAIAAKNCHTSDTKAKAPMRRNGNADSVSAEFPLKGAVPFGQKPEDAPTNAGPPDISLKPTCPIAAKASAASRRNSSLSAA